MYESLYGYQGFRAPVMFVIEGNTFAIDIDSFNDDCLDDTEMSHDEQEWLFIAGTRFKLKGRERVQDWDFGGQTFDLPVDVFYIEPYDCCAE